MREVQDVFERIRRTYINASMVKEQIEICLSNLIHSVPFRHCHEFSRVKIDRLTSVIPNKHLHKDKNDLFLFYPAIET